MAPVPHPKGTLVLVLGIVGLVCCSPAGIAAFFIARPAMAEIDANPGRYNNRGLVQAGYILGIIAMVIFVLSILWFIFAVALASN